MKLFDKTINKVKEMSTALNCENKTQIVADAIGVYYEIFKNFNNNNGGNIIFETLIFHH